MCNDAEGLEPDSYIGVLKMHLSDIPALSHLPIAIFGSKELSFCPTGRSMRVSAVAARWGCASGPLPNFIFELGAFILSKRPVYESTNCGREMGMSIESRTAEEDCLPDVGQQYVATIAHILRCLTCWRLTCPQRGHMKRIGASSESSLEGRILCPHSMPGKDNCIALYNVYYTMGHA